jgi:hypothetical protein
MISEVFDRDSYVIANAKEDIQNGDAGKFSNMPRNVYHNRGKEQFRPLLEHGNLDIAPAFLLHVATRNPDYTFYVKTGARNTASGASYYMVRNIYVLAGDEPLGAIDASSMSDSLLFRNNRVTEDLKRGSSKKTSKLSTAKSIFAQYFYGMTMQEHMQNMAANVSYEVRNTIYTLRRKKDEAQNAMVEYIKKEMLLGNEVLFKFVNDAGKGELIDTFHNMYSEMRVVQNIEDVLDKNEGYYIMLKDDEYIKWRNDESKIPKRFKRTEMPDDMRTALALLKIADKGTFVDGAGFKLADDKFFIRDEVQLDFDS